MDLNYIVSVLLDPVFHVVLGVSYAGFLTYYVLYFANNTELSALSLTHVQSIIELVWFRIIT